ncbi:hypothetical protein OH799_26820 [Nocardia sp. NBC_00881]|uniref:hypothetical protein n=1 Tax=Nocardia sp. NBC_00881 TaxID=2975995 RepID=UPI00386DC17B|nr:hypothetical protein OH799_26820 [Nocardia sp. NBC_00881]
MTTPVNAEVVRIRHRVCGEHPGEISLDVAKIILSQHAGHGEHCLQFLGALNRASVVCGEAAVTSLLRHSRPGRREEYGQEV